MKAPGTPYLVDVALNLTDCVFRGVDWKGRRVHVDSFDYVIRRAEEQNVRRMIVTGTCLTQCLKAVRLCRRYPSFLRCTVGVHPAHCAEMERPLNWDEAVAEAMDDTSIQIPCPPSDECDGTTEWRHAEERLAKMVALVEEYRDIVVAVGEIGLDYAELSYSPRDIQKKFFIHQLRSLRVLRLPFILHSRDCGTDFVELLEEELKSWTDNLPFVGVVHSFNGPLEEQQRLLAIPGIYLSINGSAFREKARAEQICSIPLERLMFETDAPWCDIRRQHYGAQFVRTSFPTNRKSEPFDPLLCNERRNEPCHLRQVLEVYVGVLQAFRKESGGAAWQDVTEETVVEQVYKNCVKVFGL
ncbi:putative TatD related DNase [Trypanosoma vivax]|nr:putative TatD related DNase [Trypanosoma vivax]